MSNPATFVSLAPFDQVCAFFLNGKCESVTIGCPSINPISTDQVNHWLNQGWEPRKALVACLSHNDEQGNEDAQMLGL